jgi:hypothetical protein
MPQVLPQEFERLPLRVHTFLAGVPLHDVWCVDLPRWRAGVTLADFLRAGRTCLFSPSSLVRMLLNIRFLIGRLFALDHEPKVAAAETFVTRLTDLDRSRSLAPTGTQDGFFRIVYRFENEQLVELINRTVHAAALSTLVETTAAYRFYFGIYVRNVSRFTPFYMALVDPFRKMIVYPSLLRTVRVRWDQAFGGDRKHNNVNCRCDKHMLPFSQS